MTGVDNAVRWTAAGLDAVHVGYRGATGFMAGFSNLTATNTGTESGMHRIAGAQTAPFTIQDATVKNILGDDDVIDTYSFANAAVNQGVLEVGETDTAFELVADGTLKKTFGIYDFLGRGGAVGNPAALMFLLTRQAHGQDSATSGQSGFENELVLYAHAKPLGDNTKAHQAEGKMRYNVTFSPSTVMPYGLTTAAELGVVTRQSIIWTSTYRSMLQCHVSDGAAATAVMAYSPVSSATTNVKAWNITTGAAATVSTVVVATKTVTLSAAGASGDIFLILYQCSSFS